MQIFDNHVHLDFGGRNILAIKEFEKLGGTHIMLVHKPYYNLKTNLPNYEEEFKKTLKLAELVRNKTAVKVFIALSPHPVEFFYLAEKVGTENAKKLFIQGIEIAEKSIKQQNAIAFGEVGRPHFSVSNEILQSANEIMKYTFEIGKEINCAIILHTESATINTFKELGKVANKVGIKKEKLIKHYSPPIIKIEENFGLFPSIIASEENIRIAISYGNRFFMETDYIDDLKRPGAVLGIKSVPRLTKEFLEKGIFSEEDVYKIHKENAERVYEVEME